MVGATPSPKNLVDFSFNIDEFNTKNKKNFLNLPTMIKTTKPIATAHYIRHWQTF